MPECQQCGDSYAASDGRWVDWEHRVGSTYGRSTGSRSGTGHSSSYGSGGMRFGNSSSRSQSSRATKRDHTRVDRVWVCNDCKAPRNYGWFQRALVFWGIVAFVIYAGAQWAYEKITVTGSPSIMSSASTSDGTKSTFTTVEGDGASALDARAQANDRSSKPPAVDLASTKPSIVFAQPKEVVEDVPDQSGTPVVKCSETVKDHCSE